MASATGLNSVELQGLNTALESQPAPVQGISAVGLLHAAVKRIARSNMALARTLQPGCSGLIDAYARYDDAGTDTGPGIGTDTSTTVAMTSADHTERLLACACGLFRIARYFIDRSGFWPP